MLSAGELRKGISIELDGEPYRIVDYQHLKLGRGSAQVRLKLKNLIKGQAFERAFQASEKFIPAQLEYLPVNFLYYDSDLFYFMDKETFEQIALRKEQLGEQLPFLKEGMELEVLSHRGQPVAIELPVAVKLKVAETGPAFKGDTATSGSKPAKLETGFIIQVPLFINPGDVVKVDTRSGEYLERVS